MRLRWHQPSESLRTRLTIRMVVVLLAAEFLIGLGSGLVIRHFLVSRLDQQLVAAGSRYAASLEHRARQHIGDRHDGDPDDVIPGQAGGTIGVRVVAGRIAEAVRVSQDGTTHSVHIDPAVRAILTEIHPGASARDVDMGALGDYRLRAVQDPHHGLQLTGLPLYPVDQTLAEILAAEAALFVVAVLTGGAATALVVRRSLRPLDQLAANARSFSALALAGGHEPLPPTVTPGSPAREVDQVGEAFNHMLDRVQTAMSQRDSTEARLRRFVADASHELRTPLATIQANAEYGLTTTDQALPEPADEALQRILTASRRMSLLTTDLLLLARLDDHQPLHYKQVDLTRLVLEAVTDAQTLAPGHRWNLNLPEEAVTVDADEAYLRRILVNLLSNARIHTPDGTVVTTGVTPTEDHAIIWVADDGPGVPPSLQADLFERFSRGDTSRSRSRGGSGLGLAIAHDIARAHGGTLTYEASGGHGACFLIHLPARHDDRDR